MNDPVKVSVVVPIYNSEEHLAECLDSLLAQTHSNIELICVDDGSQDHSLSILNDYAARDPRVRVLSQENAGPGIARNRGMDEATGDYLYFFDSDDFCDRTLIEAAVAKLLETDADLVSFPFMEYDNRVGASCEATWAATPRALSQNDVMTWRDNPDRAFQAFHNFPWNKIAKTQFIRENNIRFQEIYLTEDLMYAIPAVVRARRMTFVDGHYVHHRIGTGKNAMAAKDAHPLDFYTAFLTLREYLLDEGVYEELRTSYANWTLGGCMYNLTTMKSFEGFELVFNTLASEGLEKLGLLEVDEGIFLSDSYRSFLHALRTLTPSEYAWHLYRDAASARDLNAFNRKVDRKKHAKLAEEKNSANRRAQKLSGSLDYRIGNKLLKPTRAIKRALNKGGK